MSELSYRLIATLDEQNQEAHYWSSLAPYFEGSLQKDENLIDTVIAGMALANRPKELQALHERLAVC